MKKDQRNSNASGSNNNTPSSSSHNNNKKNLKKSSSSSSLQQPPSYILETIKEKPGREDTSFQDFTDSKHQSKSSKSMQSYPLTSNSAGFSSSYSQSSGRQQLQLQTNYSTTQTLILSGRRSLQKSENVQRNSVIYEEEQTDDQLKKQINKKRQKRKPSQPSQPRQKKTNNRTVPRQKLTNQLLQAESSDELSSDNNDNGYQRRQRQDQQDAKKDRKQRNKEASYKSLTSSSTQNNNKVYVSNAYMSDLQILLEQGSKIKKQVIQQILEEQKKNQPLSNDQNPQQQQMIQQTAQNTISEFFVNSYEQLNNLLEYQSSHHFSQAQKKSALIQLKLDSNIYKTNQIGMSLLHRAIERNRSIKAASDKKGLFSKGNKKPTNYNQNQKPSSKHLFQQQEQKQLIQFYLGKGWSDQNYPQLQLQMQQSLKKRPNKIAFNNDSNNKAEYKSHRYGYYEPKETLNFNQNQPKQNSEQILQRHHKSQTLNSANSISYQRQHPFYQHHSEEQRQIQLNQHNQQQPQKPNLKTGQLYIKVYNENNLNTKKIQQKPEAPATQQQKEFLQMEQIHQQQSANFSYIPETQYLSSIPINYLEKYERTIKLLERQLIRRQKMLKQLKYHYEEDIWELEERVEKIMKTKTVGDDQMKNDHHENDQWERKRKNPVYKELTNAFFNYELLLQENYASPEKHQWLTTQKKVVNNLKNQKAIENHHNIVKQNGGELGNNNGGQGQDAEKLFVTKADIHKIGQDILNVHMKGMNKDLQQAIQYSTFIRVQLDRQIQALDRVYDINKDTTSRIKRATDGLRTMLRRIMMSKMTRFLSILTVIAIVGLIVVYILRNIGIL